MEDPPASPHYNIAFVPSHISQKPVKRSEFCGVKNNKYMQI